MNALRKREWQAGDREEGNGMDVERKEVEGREIEREVEMKRTGRKEVEEKWRGGEKKGKREDDNWMEKGEGEKGERRGEKERENG